MRNDAIDHDIGKKEMMERMGGKICIWQLGGHGRAQQGCADWHTAMHISAGSANETGPAHPEPPVLLQQPRLGE